MPVPNPAYLGIIMHNVWSISFISDIKLIGLPMRSTSCYLLSLYFQVNLQINKHNSTFCIDFWHSIRCILLTCYVYVVVVDVCSNNDCHYNADCIPKDNSYTCTCRQGYDGSGYQCQGQIIISIYYVLWSRFFHGCLAYNSCSLSLSSVG